MEDFGTKEDQESSHAALVAFADILDMEATGVLLQYVAHVKMKDPMLAIGMIIRKDFVVEATGRYGIPTVSKSLGTSK